MMLNDQKYRQIVNEWFAHLEKGYAEPPYTKHELRVLENITRNYNLKPNNIVQTEIFQEVQDESVDLPLKVFIPLEQSLIETGDIESITQSQLNTLKAKLGSEELKQRYSKYLTVFYYFSPNALGEISEILLAKLLGGSHTGASQGLEDLNVDGISISLKTTLSGDAINLGSEKGLIPKNSTIASIAAMKLETEASGSIFEKMSIYDIENRYGYNNSPYLETIKDINDRIDAIATKLSGASNNEYFVWIEKNIKNGILVSLVIHTKRFLKDKVIADLKNSYVRPSRSGWSIYNNTGVLVAASTAGKYLNINPLYIRTVKTENDSVEIQLANLSGIIKRAPDPSDTGAALSAKLKTAASDTFFKMLDGIYDKFISSVQ
jgi:hypothetical protein